MVEDKRIPEHVALEQAKKLVERFPDIKTIEEATEGIIRVIENPVTKRELSPLERSGYGDGEKALKQ